MPKILDNNALSSYFDAAELSRLVVLLECSLKIFALSALTALAVCEFDSCQLDANLVSSYWSRVR